MEDYEKGKMCMHTMGNNRHPLSSSCFQKAIIHSPPPKDLKQLLYGVITNGTHLLITNGAHINIDEGRCSPRHAPTARVNSDFRTFQLRNSSEMQTN